MPVLQPVDSTSFRAQAWANGGGTTTELAAGPDRDHWDWRISLAQVDGDGPFSSLPGVRRQIAPLDGRLQLQFADAGTRIVHRLEVLTFDGGQPVDCHLLDGPGRDLNLMLRNGAEGTLVLRPLVGSMVLLPQAGWRWFAYMIGGHCQLDAGAQLLSLATGEAAWVEPEAGRRVLVEGGGELALVKLAATVP
ncbi:MAG TPA: HutD family protein [Rhodanobacteraceae bacterium]